MKLIIRKNALLRIEVEKDEKGITIVIPDGVQTIKADAFQNAAWDVRVICIPASVQEIEDGALYGDRVYWNSLEEIYVDENNARYKSEDGCLIEKQTKTLLLATNVTPRLSKNVKIIHTSVFNSHYKRKELIIPANVKIVRALAFSHSYFERIIFEGMPESIEEGAFVYNPELKEVVFQETGRYVFESGCLIDRQTQTVLVGTRSAKIPEGIKAIGEGAFFCAELDEPLYIPESVERIAHSSAITVSPRGIIVKCGSYAAKFIKADELLQKIYHLKEI